MWLLIPCNNLQATNRFTVWKSLPASNGHDICHPGCKTNWILFTMTCVSAHSPADSRYNLIVVLHHLISDFTWLRLRTHSAGFRGSRWRIDKFCSCDSSFQFPVSLHAAVASCFCQSIYPYKITLIRGFAGVFLIWHMTAHTINWACSCQSFSGQDCTCSVPHTHINAPAGSRPPRENVL